MPKIEPNWKRDRLFKLRPFLTIGLALFLVILALFLTPFKSCTNLGRVAKERVFKPSEDGLIKKTNQLLAKLLAQSADVNATDLESLNKRYPALTFALPYGEEQKPVIEATDLRLVGINPAYLDDDDRMFYYNSRLPQLLHQQKEQMAETYFQIESKGTKYDHNEHKKPLDIKRITLIPSMFKVELAKNPWVGSISAPENCLFTEDNARFLVYGNSMIPVPIEEDFNGVGTPAPVFKADVAHCALYNEKSSEIDYYKVYRDAFDKCNPSRAKHVDIHLFKKISRGNILAGIQITCTKDEVCILSDNDVKVFSSNMDVQTIKGRLSGAQHGSCIVKFSDGMKIVVFDRNNHKVGEFALNHHDPTRTLSNLIQTNTGTTRYKIAPSQTDLFTQQLIRGIARHLSNGDNIDEVKLTIDPMLSREFEREIKNYLSIIQENIHHPACQKKDQYDISFTIMDMNTGNILASPFYTTKFDKKDFPEELKLTTRNVSLSRRYLGSTFKPFIALAAVQANPNLLNLDTHGKYSVDLSSSNNAEPWKDKKLKANFFGRKTRAWAKAANTRGQWYGTTFTSFLAHSDDIYPVALAAQAMTFSNTVDYVLKINQENNFFTLDSKGMLCFKKDHVNVLSHPFTNWVSYITELNSKSTEETYLDMFRNLKGVEYKDSLDRLFGLDEIAPDITNLHMDDFCNGNEFRSVLVPWVLGQGNNEWTCFAIAQAWARMISRHDIRASFIQGGSQALNLTMDNNGVLRVPGSNVTGGNVRTSNEINGTWNSFLDKFRAAQSHIDNEGSNTLFPMFKRVEALNTTIQNTNDKLVLFSKTGTPDAYDRYEIPLMGGNNRYFDIGLYTFSLMREGDYSSSKNGNLPRGIVCVIRVTRTYECEECNKVAKKGEQCESCKKNQGLTSSHARDFMSYDRLRKLYDMTRRYITN